jgi:hypothetical protein
VYKFDGARTVEQRQLGFPVVLGFRFSLVSILRPSVFMWLLSKDFVFAAGFQLGPEEVFSDDSFSSSVRYHCTRRCRHVSLRLRLPSGRNARGYVIRSVGGHAARD